MAQRALHILLDALGHIGRIEIRPHEAAAESGEGRRCCESSYSHRAVSLCNVAELERVLKEEKTEPGAASSGAKSKFSGQRLARHATSRIQADPGLHAPSWHLHALLRSLRQAQVDGYRRLQPWSGYLG